MLLDDDEVGWEALAKLSPPAAESGGIHVASTLGRLAAR
jgi:hypothetical protein